MSLLIDALRQAEAAQKNQPQVETTGPDLELEAGPVEKPETTVPFSVPESSASKPVTPDTQARAQELFDIKHSQHNTIPLILAAGGLLALLAGGAYLWWATNRSSSIQAPAALAHVIAPPLAAAHEAQQASVPEAISNQPLSPRRSVPEKPLEPQIKPAVPAQKNERKLFESGALKRSPAEPRTSISPIQQAHAAYQQGQFAAAHAGFNEVLRTDQHNTDALNALGLIELRAGRAKEAENFFRRALQADPKNAQAVSQLAGLYATSNPAGAESRLKSLLAEQPESAEALFALGSVYARQGRWVEAQQSFFQAHTLDAKNPDSLYNLAVALDHLQQTSLAAQYYEQAATAATAGVNAFDPALARQRAASLRATPNTSAP